MAAWACVAWACHLSGVGGEDGGVGEGELDGGVELEGDQVFRRVEDGVRPDDLL